MSADNPLIEAKRALRRRMKRLRAQSSGAQRISAAWAVAAAFPLDPVRPPRIVSGFHPMGAEIDPAPLMRRLAEAGAQLCLPVVVERGAPLRFRAAVAPGDLMPDAAGIPAPPPTAPELDPDFVLAPLLAFDAQGWRLGYGGGYYDRTLHALRRRVPTLVVGLGFSFQYAAVVPHGPGDERLDAMLTESGYKAFVHKDV